MRRLAAIMFTDMVGYSALTQKNESLALQLLTEHRSLVRPFFDKHEGREIETAGDSFFVEFNSAVEATQCAIEIQAALHERNETVEPERQIRLRIGLHIGDVVYIDKPVHGDGVNIAARLEPLAQPGGICISEDVARQIRNKVPYDVIKLGEEKLKNISMPMDIYCIALPWLQIQSKIKKSRSRANEKSKYKVLPIVVGLATIIAVVLFFIINSKQNTANAAITNMRLAVLPLSNISNDSTDEYFADGMTEELISSLSKIGGLNVIARTSVMKYKSTDKSISQIGNELMVGSILEGSVRRNQNKARITVKLVDVNTQEHMWSMEYDRELKDIFRIQSEIAKDVVNKLKVRMLSTEKEQLEKNNTSDMVALEEYLLGKHFLNQRTPAGVQSSIAHFEKAISQDPSFALPYASLAYAYTLTGVAGYGDLPRNIAEKKAKDAVMKALELDPTLAEAHAALGYMHFRIDWNWTEAEKELKRAIDLKPGFATAHEWYALFLACQTRLDEALREINKAWELDPLSPNVNNGLARIYHFRNENDKAIAQAKKTIEMEPAYAEAYFTLGMTYGKMKEYDKALETLLKAIDLSGRRHVIVGLLGNLYARMGKIDKAKELLKELETQPVNNDKLYAAVIIKSALGQSEESLRILEQLVNDRYGILIYMKVERSFFNEGNTSRYHELLKRVNL